LKVIKYAKFKAGKGRIYAMRNWNTGARRGYAGKIIAYVMPRLPLHFFITENK